VSKNKYRQAFAGSVIEEKRACPFGLRQPFWPTDCRFNPPKARPGIARLSGGWRWLTSTQSGGEEGEHLFRGRTGSDPGWSRSSGQI